MLDGDVLRNPATSEDGEHGAERVTKCCAKGDEPDVLLSHRKVSFGARSSSRKRGNMREQQRER